MEERTLINEPYKFLFLFILFIDKKTVIKTYIKCVLKYYKLTRSFDQSSAVDAVTVKN